MKQLLFFVALLIAGQAQALNYQVFGDVVDGLGNPLQGITVQLCYTSGVMETTTVTDSLGTFSFPVQNYYTKLVKVPAQDGWTFTPAQVSAYVNNNPVDTGVFTGAYTPPHHKKKSGGCALSNMSGAYWLEWGLMWTLVALIGHRYRPKG
jgi:hypothetical protein